MYSFNLLEAFDELNKIYESENDEICNADDVPLEVQELIAQGAKVYSEEPEFLKDATQQQESLKEDDGDIPPSPSHYDKHTFQANANNGSSPPYINVKQAPTEEEEKKFIQELSNIGLPPMTHDEYNKRALELANHAMDKRWPDGHDIKFEDCPQSGEDALCGYTYAFVCQEKKHITDDDKKDNKRKGSVYHKDENGDFVKTDRNSTWRVCKFRKNFGLVIDKKYFHFDTQKRNRSYMDYFVPAEYDFYEVVYYTVTNTDRSSTDRKSNKIVFTYLFKPEREILSDLRRTQLDTAPICGLNTFTGTNFDPMSAANDVTRQSIFIVPSFVHSSDDKLCVQCCITNNQIAAQNHLYTKSTSKIQADNIQSAGSMAANKYYNNNDNALGCWFFNGTQLWLAAGSNDTMFGEKELKPTTKKEINRQSNLLKWISNYVWLKNPIEGFSSENAKYCPSELIYNTAKVIQKIIKPEKVGDDSVLTNETDNSNNVAPAKSKKQSGNEILWPDVVSELNANRKANKQAGDTSFDDIGDYKETQRFAITPEVEPPFNENEDKVISELLNVILDAVEDEYYKESGGGNSKGLYVDFASDYTGNLIKRAGKGNMLKVVFDGKNLIDPDTCSETPNHHTKNKTTRINKATANAEQAIAQATAQAKMQSSISLAQQRTFVRLSPREKEPVREFITKENENNPLVKKAKTRANNSFWWGMEDGYKYYFRDVYFNGAHRRGEAVGFEIGLKEPPGPGNNNLITTYVVDFFDPTIYCFEEVEDADGNIVEQSISPASVADKFEINKQIPPSRVKSPKRTK